MERFLYRLSKTKWADCLIVKGAAMLRVWDGAVARPTRDIDFLGRIKNSPEAVAAMVRECLAVESADGVEFSAEVTVEPITIEDRYPGVRALVETALMAVVCVWRDTRSLTPLSPATPSCRPSRTPTST